MPVRMIDWSAPLIIAVALAVVVWLFFRKGKNARKVLLGDLVDQQKSVPRSVTPDISVAECVRLMNEVDIGAILVMENGELMGIFTERDAMTKVLGTGLEPTYTKVSAVMSHNPTCASPSTTMDEAMTIISTQRIRHLPVVQDGRVLGMVSSGDLTHWLVNSRSGLDG